MAKAKQAEFTKYLGPVLDALRELGGSGRPKEVQDRVAKNLNISDKIREETLKNGSSKWDNQIAWARQYLVYVGLIDNSKRGVWVLTPSGHRTTLNEKQGHEIFLNHVAILQKERKGKNNEEITEKKSKNEIVKETTLLEILKTISPVGFEHLCQRLLREIGFENVEITQRSHDEGVDGFGSIREAGRNLEQSIAGGAGTIQEIRTILQQVRNQPVGTDGKADGGSGGGAAGEGEIPG